MKKGRKLGLKVAQMRFMRLNPYSLFSNQFSFEFKFELSKLSLHDKKQTENNPIHVLSINGVFMIQFF